MLRAFGEHLFGEQSGQDAARVLALPGWMRQRGDFRGVLEGLDAIALDLPGFGGASPEPTRPLSSQEYAELVAPVLELCDPRVVVLGHSFGGRVAVHLAAANPERLGALVLTGVPRLVPPATTSKPKPSYRVARWLHGHHLLSDRRMEAIRREQGSTDYRNATTTMRGVLVQAVNEDYASLLAHITCPVELVWGSDDTAATVAMADQARPLFGGPTTLTVVPGAGHLTPLTAAPALRAAIDAHLAA